MTLVDEAVNEFPILRPREHLTGELRTQTAKRLRKLFDEGRSIPELVALTGYNDDRVEKLLEEAGAAFRPTHHHRRATEHRPRTQTVNVCLPVDVLSRIAVAANREGINRSSVLAALVIAGLDTGRPIRELVLAANSR